MSSSRAEISYLSYSSISLYLSCSEAWRRRYIEGIKSPSTPTLLFGSAIHDTIEGAVRARVEQETQPSLPDLFVEQWSRRVAEESNCEWGADLPETHQEDGLRLVNSKDFAALVRRLTPLRDEAGLCIERKIELTVPGVPVPIIGYIDMITADGVPADFKTAARMWDADRARLELQPLFYLAALNQMGRTVPGLRFRHFVMTKGKTPRVAEFETAHSWDSIFWLFDLIRSAWKGIAHEVFIPNPNTAWLCSPKYCNHWSTCRGRGL